MGAKVFYNVKDLKSGSTIYITTSVGASVAKVLDNNPSRQLICISYFYGTFVVPYNSSIFKPHRL